MGKSDPGGSRLQAPNYDRASGRSGFWRRQAVIAFTGVLLQGCGDVLSPDGHLEEPSLTVKRELLEAALSCTAFTHPDKPPVLLVHGTFATADLQFPLFYGAQFLALGYDVCTVTYSDRGLGDVQISAEYILYAVREIRARSGRKLAMLGHSQGATMPRWALKYWPSIRNDVSDFVMLAAPNHGTTAAVAGELSASLGEIIGPLPVGLLPAVMYQLAPSSRFIASLNARDETPGEVDYTSIYSLFDELVRPVVPEATAALEPGQGNPHVANVLIQDICPAALVDHATIGLTDPISFALAIDAIKHAGPADVVRAGGGKLCTLLPVDIEALLATPWISGSVALLMDAIMTGVPDPHLVAEEPPLQPYADAP